MKSVPAQAMQLQAMKFARWPALPGREPKAVARECNAIAIQAVSQTREAGNVHRLPTEANAQASITMAARSGKWDQSTARTSLPSRSSVHRLV